MSGICLHAQDSTSSQPPPAKKKWTFLVEPYFMFPSMNGTTGVGELPDTELDASPDDIFSNFKIGYMLNFEMAYDRWVMYADEIYMNLEQDTKTGTVVKSGEVSAKQFAWETGGLYRLLPFLEAGVGFRLNNIKVETNIVTNNGGGGTVNRTRELNQTWVDPIIVARIKSKLSKKFVYLLRGDIGGFGIGSDFAWQIQAYAGYRFSRLFEVTAGYRVLSADYNTGSGQDRFKYDVDTFGPVIRVGFNF